MGDALIHAHNLVKIYQVAGLEVVALQGLDLNVTQGEVVALVGPSGSGKSTLLAALAGLERPSAGMLSVAGRNVLALDAAALARYRREMVGVVWQQTGRNLLAYLSARENVELLAQLNGSSRAERRAWANELLAAVGMGELAGRRPTTLSGGQQQRVALACALANRPQILLADEPTGEVDWPTAEQILALLQDLRQRYGLTVVLVTHDPRVAAHADRVVAIRDGRTSTESTMVAGREEFLVVDRVGRLQLGAEQRAQAGIGGRVRAELIADGLLLRPIGDDGMQAPELSDPEALVEDAPPAPRPRWWQRR
jgi:peptide/nickel transport system ATP-binding protein